MTLPLPEAVKNTDTVKRTMDRVDGLLVKMLDSIDPIAKERERRALSNAVGLIVSETIAFRDGSPQEDGFGLQIAPLSSRVDSQTTARLVGEGITRVFKEIGITDIAFDAPQTFQNSLIPVDEVFGDLSPTTYNPDGAWVFVTYSAAQRQKTFAAIMNNPDVTDYSLLHTSITVIQTN